MSVKSNIFVAVLAAFSFGGFAGGAAASTVPSCAVLDSSTQFDSFSSCTSVKQKGGGNGNDNFMNVNEIVTRLFADEGISITESGSFSSGPGTGSEFTGTRISDGFVIAEPNLNRTSFTFLSLPMDTIFVSLKQGSSFELFRVPEGGTPFMLSHSLNGNNTSHISTFAGTVPSPVPLPAAGVLLMAGLGGLGFLRRSRKKVAA